MGVDAEDVHSYYNLHENPSGCPPARGGRGRRGTHADPNRVRDCRSTCRPPRRWSWSWTPGPSGTGSIRRPGRLRVEPSKSRSSEYVDGFGNRCTRLVAPPGRITLWDDAVVEDSGLPDEVAPHAIQHPIQDLPAGRPGLPPGQPLLRGRPPLRHRLGTLRPDPRGLGPGPGDLRLGPQPRHLRLPVRPAHQVGPRRLRGAPGRLPRLHPPGPDLLPVHEHPGPLRDRLPGRHRRPALGQPDGLQRLVRGLPRAAGGTPWTPATTSRGSAGS